MDDMQDYADPFERSDDYNVFEERQLDRDAERASEEQEHWPVAIIDREDLTSGVWLIRNADEMRAHILDDLSYMRDDPDSDEDKAEYAALEAMGLDELMLAYFEDSDMVLSPVYEPDPVRPGDGVVGGYNSVVGTPKGEVQ